MELRGVLGGTFDPIHLGHLRAAEWVRERCGLSKVLFVPAAAPPHKLERQITDVSDRVAMLEKALSNETRFELCLTELTRKGPSYTIDTLRELAEREPDPVWCFITGADTFLEIQTWSRWEALVSEFSFVVPDRPGFRLEDMAEVVPVHLHDRLQKIGEVALKPPVIGLLEGEMLNISSTEIRRLSREGRSVRYLVPDAVAAYIEENRLYREGT